jgi:hypothetical protein
MTEKELSDRLERIENKIDMGFNGPEGQPERGLTVRVDRLEQLARALVGALAVLGTTVLGLIVKFFSTGTPPASGNHP